MPLFLFLFFLLMVAYAVLIGYYHTAWNHIPQFVEPGQQPSVAISVIIAVRNEEKNIQPLLDSLYAQNYPKELYEVIVVDDHSTDNTWSLLQQVHYENLQLVR